MSYQLKLLSGTLNGVEYALHVGDTLFHIGSPRDLQDGQAAQLLQGAENAYFLPEDLPPGAFVVQLGTGEGGSATLRLGERSRADQAWHYRPLAVQTVYCANGIHFAVRDTAQSWASDVLGFAPTARTQLVPAADDALPGTAARLSHVARSRRPWFWGASMAMLTIALAAGWYYWQYRPEVRVQGLAGVLRDAPADYQILPGGDGKLYAFSDDRNAPAWGRRASRRLQRRDDVYLLRRDEATRLEQSLLKEGLAVVIVRLDQPAQPHVVLLGGVTPALRERVREQIGQIAPYATGRVQISSTTDAALVALAQAQLRGLGISSRTEPQGSRVSVVNDVFLDDAALNAMAGMAERFHRDWGERRITVHLQLWDDLLQGRSYRYSPGQLMSVGEGRWTYARSITGGQPAAQ